MKKCFKCGIEKELRCFYVHPVMGDGHLNKCIDCTKKDAREHRIKNIEKIQEYDRERGRTRKRKKLNRDRQRNATPEQRERLKIFRKRWLEKNQDRRAAQVILGHAVRDGRIEKPNKCGLCGNKGMIHGHHSDYTKPLDVLWLCVSCHAKKHRKYE